VLTIGFARRAAAYKRGTLVFHDIERLAKISELAGPVQIVFSGKAHPRDQDGKDMIHKVHELRDILRGRISVAYLTNYDMTVAKLVCAGADVWLNTPLPPMEAQGPAA